MPPESFRNKPASTAGDIWATGCIMHRTMIETDNILFKSDTKEENTDAQVAERIWKHVPRRLPKFYSREFRAYVWLMLQKEPAGRPSAKEVLDFL